MFIDQLPVIDETQENLDPRSMRDVPFVIEKATNVVISKCKAVELSDDDVLELEERGRELSIAVTTAVAESDTETYLKILDSFDLLAKSVGESETIYRYRKVSTVLKPYLKEIINRFANKLGPDIPFDELNPTIKVLDKIFVMGLSYPVAEIFDQHRSELSDCNLLTNQGNFNTLYPNYLRFCLTRGRSTDIQFIARELANYQAQSSYELNYYEVSQEMLTAHRDIGIDIVTEKVVNPKLSDAGLVSEFPPDLVEIWYANSYTQPYKRSLKRSVEQDIQMNIDHYIELERQRPGAAKVLRTRFGISNYGRYPVEMLIDQFDNMDNDTLPYGVILYPTTDYNGAFIGQQSAFESLLTSSKVTGCHVRIFECNGVLGRKGINRSLYNCNQWYGQSTIEWAIVGGHGNPRSIRISDNQRDKSNNEVNIQQLKNRRTSSMRNYFKPEATILLISCSTGVKDGISEVINERVGLKTIAPTEGANTSNMSIYKTKNGAFTITSLFQDPNQNVVDSRYIGFNLHGDEDPTEFVHAFFVGL